MAGVVLELRGVTRTYSSSAGELEVLRGADLTLKAGELVGLVGPSGSGKSTLLHLAGLLEPPQSGEILLGERRVGTCLTRL
jgi:lipoprotein-releasing system ATP-binding protein